MTPTPEHLDEFYTASEAVWATSLDFVSATYAIADAVIEHSGARRDLAQAIVENDPNLREFVLRYYDAQQTYIDTTERVARTQRAYADACNALIDWTSKATSLGGA